MLLPLKALSYNSKFLETKIGNRFEQLTIINFIRLFPLPFPHFTSQTPTNIRFELPFYYFVCTITIRFYEHKGVKGCGRLESNCGVAGPKNNANYICSKKLQPCTTNLKRKKRDKGIKKQIRSNFFVHRWNYLDKITAGEEGNISSPLHLKLLHTCTTSPPSSYSGFNMQLYCA